VKVAILGSRGIPARYSGYDTLVEELSAGLVETGVIEVTVYCRRAYFDSWPELYRGCSSRLPIIPAHEGRRLSLIPVLPACPHTQG
jgi:hypothetical protein